MSEGEDYSSLPLEERLVHKVWKVRLTAYEELDQIFTKSSIDQDASCFLEYSQPELFKKIVTDSNVVAQELGIKSLCSILEFGGSKVSLKLRSVINPLCEKSFISARAGTKLKATELLMLFIESTSPEPNIEQILPFLTHKIPKVVASATKSLTDILSQFGCKTCSPKLIIPLLPKLFAHADKNVRLEATNLSVEIYKWIGPSFEQMIFPDLKPVQQKDLKTVFENIQDKPVQIRFLQSQKLDEAKVDNDQDGDVDMEGAVADYIKTSGDDTLAPLDPYDIAESIDVLSNLPNDFYSRIAAVKWSERKEVLDELHKVVNVIKIQDLNFSDLIRCLGKSIAKDANIQVVMVAANCVESLAKGLRNLFDKYVSLILPSLLERAKEKKQSVAEALSSALDAVFASSSFGQVNEEIAKFLSHKTPQVKIATAQFLARCLLTTPVAPTIQEYEVFLPSAVKLLSDSQEPVRSAASNAIGTLMKITGERELDGHFEKIDENRMSKVKESYENAVVVAIPKQKPKMKAAAKVPVASISKPITSRSSLTSTKLSRPSLSFPNNNINNSSNRQATSGLKKPTLAYRDKDVVMKVTDDPLQRSSYQSKIKPLISIPSKRAATSPLKLEHNNKPGGTRLNNVGRSLTSTTLNHSNSPPLIQSQRELPSLEKEELESLRLEKLEWLKEREHFQWKINDNATREERLMKEINSLQFKNESLIEEHTRDIINLKSKETQLARLQSDLQNARQKIESLESSQITKEFIPERLSPMRTKYISPFEDPTPGSDLSAKVKRLSIDNKDKENNSPQLDFSRSKVELELDNNDDSWRRAAEVTSQLKARIEKMKARSRSNVSSFGSTK